MLDIQLCAGDGSYHENAPVIDKIPMSLVWLNKHGFSPTKVEFIYVKGDCMEPNLNDGDLVLVDKSRTEIKSGKIYAYCYDGEANIKRLFIEGSKITMKPDNPIFITRTIGKQEAGVNGFKVIGQIVFAPRLLL